MPNNDLTIEAVQSEIQSRLGGNTIGVDVELEPNDYLICLRRALRLYNRNRSRRGRARLPASIGQKKYDVTMVPDPNLSELKITGVPEVQFLPSRLEFGATLDPFNYQDRVGMLLSGDTYGDLQNQLAYVKDAKVTTGAEPDWVGQWEGDGHYYLYVDIKSPTEVGYTYTYDIPVNPILDQYLALIDSSDTELIFDYVEACAKKILGRIRGKFGGIPNADGSQDPIDSDQLLQEASTEMAEVEERFKNRRRPLPPVIG